MKIMFFDGLIRRPLHVDRMKIYELPLILTDLGAQAVTLPRLRKLGEECGAHLTCRPNCKCMKHVHEPRISGFLCAGSQIEARAWEFANIAQEILGIDIEIVYYDDTKKIVPGFPSEMFTCRAVA